MSALVTVYALIVTWRVPVKCEMKRETERNVTKFTKTKRNEMKRNEIYRNGTERNKMKCTQKLEGNAI